MTASLAEPQLFDQILKEFLFRLFPVQKDRKREVLLHIKDRDQIIELIDKTSGEERVNATFHYNANPTLAAKNVYTYNITLEKPQIVVTVDNITAWTSGGEASTGSAGLVQ